MYTIIEAMSIICSVIGAALFIKGIHYENQIIETLKKIRNPKDWKAQRGYTIFFLIGYIVNIIAISLHLTELQLIFMGLVFLLGALFLVNTVYIANKTYQAIFKAAEEDLGADLELKRE